MARMESNSVHSAAISVQTKRYLWQTGGKIMLRDALPKKQAEVIVHCYEDLR